MDCPAGENEPPELPGLTNKAGRIKWLEDVDAWGLWYEDPNIQARYYKYDFADGSRLVAVKYLYTSLPYMREKPLKYKEQLDADGSYYGKPVYHMVYSRDYWEDHMDEYHKKYEKYYTHNTVEIPELEKFIRWLQGNLKFSLVRHVEFDPAHLEEDEIKDLPFLTKRYIRFYKKYGYIPRAFNAKNATEVKGCAPTLTTSSGSFTGIGSVAFFDLLGNINGIMGSSTFSPKEKEIEAAKLLQIASPAEREKAVQKLGGILAVQAGGEIGRVKFMVSKLSPQDCFALMGMPGDGMEKASAAGVSDSQLYRQAGNGIVTNCVSLLAEHLYKAQYDSSYECTDEKLAPNSPGQGQRKDK